MSITHLTNWPFPRKGVTALVSPSGLPRLGACRYNLSSRIQQKQIAHEYKNGDTFFSMFLLCGPRLANELYSFSTFIFEAAKSS